MGQGAPTSAATTVIDADIPCASCGYNLRTLALTGICPECAMPVRESIETIRRLQIRLGPPLSAESRRWLMVGGMGFFIYVAATLATFLAATLMRGRAPAWLFIAVAMISHGLRLSGVWMITRPSSAEPERWKWMRLVARVALMAAIVLYLVFAVGAIVPLAQPPISRFMWATWIWGVNAIATMIGFAWLAQLARRMRRPYLRAWCFILSAAATIMLNSALQMAMVRLRPWLPSLPEVIADVPLIGTVYNFRAAPFVPYAIAVANSLTLVWFGILFIRETRHAAPAIRLQPEP